MPFHPHRRPNPDWDRAERLAAQLEYERDARDRAREVEHVGGEWSPSHHCARRAA